jgi:nucleotide-binding universal stress UspA family protein
LSDPVEQTEEALNPEDAMVIEFRHLLTPIDFGDSSNKGLDVAVDLAKRFGSSLTLVHVYEIPAYVYGGVMYAPTDLFAPLVEAARTHLQEALQRAQATVPDTKAMLRRGAPAYEILAAIDELHPDLVVMGTHGRKGVSHLLLGSVAEKVVRLSRVPVLTFRDRDPA